MKHFSLQLQMKSKVQRGWGYQDKSPPDKLIWQFTCPSLPKKMPKQHTATSVWQSVKQGTRWRYAENKWRREETEVWTTPASFSVLDIVLLWNLVVSQVSPWCSRLSYTKQEQFDYSSWSLRAKYLTYVDWRITTIATFIKWGDEGVRCSWGLGYQI